MTALRRGEIAHAFIWTGNYCGRRDVTSASSPLLSHFPPLCLPACVQLSDSGPRRSKREALADGSTQPYPETQQSITLLSPRKETHLLVSEQGFVWSPRACAAKNGQMGYDCAKTPTAWGAKEPKDQLLLLDATLTRFFILANSTSVFYEANQRTNCFRSPGLHTSEVLTPWSFLKDCSKQTARCVTFTCPLLNMTREATIVVRSRLWNSTMLEVSAAGLNAAHSRTPSTVRLTCVVFLLFQFRRITKKGKKKGNLCMFTVTIQISDWFWSNYLFNLTLFFYLSYFILC